MLRVLIATLCVLAVSAAYGEDAAMPSAAQRLQALETSTAAVESARRTPSTSASDLPSAASLIPSNARAPRTGALPGVNTAADASAQLRALIERVRNGALVDASAALPRDAAPLVFVSLSMPEASLRALLAHGRPIGAALVLRGLLDESMKRTVERLTELLGTAAGAAGEAGPGAETSVLIDPTLFDRFEIDAVPAFVLPLEAPTPCDAAGRCATPRHVKLAGDVGLAYALDVMAREASDPDVRAAAARWARTARDAK